MSAKFEDVVKVITETKVNIDVLGNKSGVETQASRIAEAVKFAPYIKGDKTPKLPQSAIFTYVTKEKGLKLANVQLQHWHKGNKVPTGKVANASTAAFTPVESDTGIYNMQRVADDEVVIKKSKITFFELLWSVATDAQKAEVTEKVADAAKQAVLDAAEAAALKATREMYEMFGKPPVITPVDVPVKKLRKQLQEEAEQEISDFLTRMKEIITANTTVDKDDLDRLIDLKGKGNQLAADLVEAFEISPEATTQA